MSKIRQIEISFPVEVDLPPGWERALDGLVGMVCEAYEAANPTRVMWPAGHGAKPVWNEPKEPDFDRSIFAIEVAEREDLYGRNPLNPDRDRLRAEALAARTRKP